MSGGPSERAPQCARTCSTARRALAVLRELVDGGRSRWTSRRLLDDSTALEVLQPRGEDVRAAAVEPGVEIRVPQAALLEKLTDDEQRPALADEVEGVCDRAVLVVRLCHDGRIVPRELPNKK